MTPLVFPDPFSQLMLAAVVNKVRHEFRQIFFEMGFEEMPTNRWVT